MQYIKSFTDLSQSKALSKILPIESADMHWTKKEEHLLPCWSLAALLGVLPDEITDDGDIYRNEFFHLKGKYIMQYTKLTTLYPSLLSVEDENAVNACCKMIIKLHEFNIL